MNVEMFACYLKAIALYHHHPEVTEEDFAEFRILFQYFNFFKNPLKET